MSWKQYGGLNMLDTNNLNLNTLSVDNIILRKAYAGNFDICGSLVVNTNVYVDQDLFVYGNTTLNNTQSETLLVNGDTDFFGDVRFHGTFTSRGNVLTQDSIESIGNTTVGTYLFINNHTENPSSFPYFYSNSNGMGVNRNDPYASFDICSNQTRAFSVISQTPFSQNIVAQNKDHRGIVLTTSNEETGIDFFMNTPIDLEQYGSSYIYADNKNFNIYTDDNIWVHGNLQLNGQSLNAPHIKNETLLVNDSCQLVQTPFYHEIYFDDTAYTANASTFISDDPESRSVTMLQFTNLNHLGGGIGAGNYPHQPNKAMMIKGLSTDSSDNFVPTEIVVSGSNKTKYLSTTGINTYKPRVDEVVMDINGPVRIDNSDINRILTTDFQIKYLNHSRIDKNTIMAIGTSNDISGSFQIDGINYYRYNIWFSRDYGKTWVQQTIFPVLPIEEQGDDAVLNGDILNQVDLYDISYAFITGNNNTIAYTYDGGYLWQSMILFDQYEDTIPTTDFNAIFVQDIYSEMPTEFLTVYMSLNNNQFTKFDVNLSEMNYIRPIGSVLTKNVTIHNSSMNKINNISVSENRIYLVGDKIQVYSTDFEIISNTVLHSYGNFIWNYLQVYDDMSVIAVGHGTLDSAGKGIISSTTDGGVTWTDTIFNSSINDVSYYDKTNAIAIGSAGTILVTSDGGLSWDDMNPNIYNSSGKELLISHSSIELSDIAIVNKDTILIATLSIPYIQSSQYGKSFVYSCFLPKYMNHRNNNVLDICGNMGIYGDVFLHSPCKYIQSDSDTIELLNVNVNKLYFAGDAANIYIGNAVASAIQARGDLYVSGNIYTPQSVTCTTFNHVYENFEYIGCDHYKPLTNAIDITTDIMSIYGNTINIDSQGESNNMILIGNVTEGTTGNIMIGGMSDTITFNGSVFLNSNVEFHSDLSANGNLFLQNDIQINGNTFQNSNSVVAMNQTVNGELSVMANISAGNNLSLENKLTVGGNASFNGDFLVNNSTGILHFTSNPRNNIGIGNDVLENVSIGGNNIALGNHVLTQNELGGSDNIGIGDHALYAATDGYYNIGIGKKAATSIYTGAYNVAIGNVALGSSTTGNYNISVGASSMFTALNGDNNVTIGSYSLHNINGGNNNVAIGTNSGYNYDNYLTTNCTFIGSNARAILPDGVSAYNAPINNSMAIGYNSVVNGDNQIVIGTSGENIFIPCPTVTIGKSMNPYDSGIYALDVSGFVSASNYNVISDYRLFTNISNLTETVDNLHPVSYNNTVTGKSEMGFLAHEVQTIFPNLINGIKDGLEYQTMNYSGLISLLVKEIIAMKTKISALETAVQNL